jgi:3-oxoacyl-[acyl-carrier-protein] synthase III
MKKEVKAAFVATGSYIPEERIKNDAFLTHRFYEKDGSEIKKDNATIIRKFREITGIDERRYVRPEQTASTIGYLAALDALDSSGIDKESLDYIIVAHNFGDVQHGSNRVDLVPSLASRIKYLLGIANPDCVAYDIAFGCPGWVEGVIQASFYIRAGEARRCLVIGTETLSRVVDPHDRDTMLYSDGAGAAIIEVTEDREEGVILSHKTQTHAMEYAHLLNMGPSYDTSFGSGRDMFIKMNGRKLYEFALTHVPLVIKAALEAAKVPITDIKKVLIHQANDKMDAAILERLFKLYHIDTSPEDLMPMTISWLGNSSVATVPTLLDLIQKGKLKGQELNKGDKVILASVGAGMNINAVIYQF